MEVRVVNVIGTSEAHIYAVTGFIKYYLSHQSNAIYQLTSVDHHFIITVLMANNFEQIVVFQFSSKICQCKFVCQYLLLFFVLSIGNYLFVLI